MATELAYRNDAKSRGPFRRPDVSVPGSYWLWYGPAGRDGDCATEVEECHGGYIVREYQDVSGLIENPDDTFLVRETFVEASGPYWAAQYGVLKLAYEGGEESWADALP